MNTQTHILMGALLFGRKVPRTAWAGAAGGIAPDVPMLAIVAVLRLSGYSFGEIFGRLYWQNWWQIANAIGHNFLLWNAVFAVSLWLARKSASPTGSRATLVSAFSGSALIHALIDFLCHREDAHMQFWPITRWKFVSPVSYWDPAFYGREFGLFEAILGIALAVALFRTWRRRQVRTALALTILLYAAVPAFFIFNLGS
jgi:membrane-bound metal-dependent hydrolase YbcI (DUF457 family)